MHTLPQEIAKLLWADLQDKLSGEEKERLMTWVNASPYRQALYHRVHDEPTLQQSLQEYESIDAETAWHTMQQRIGDLTEETTDVSRQAHPNSNGRKKYYWVAAAAIALLLGTSIYRYYYSSVKINVTKSTLANNKQHDVAPATNGAILTLSDGSEVLLDTVKNGALTLQNGVKAKVVDGQLYIDKENTTTALNTLSTPMGRQYHLTLPDGTQAWLNSASSITFPTAFASDKRAIQISGEVFLDVAKNKLKPFWVTTPQGAIVRVTGTEFNMHAYQDESVEKITLLQGGINMLTKGYERVIEPGQQALYDKKAETLSVTNKVDINKVVAWKNGLFNFDGDDLEEVVRQLERWYNLKVDYVGKRPMVKFFGEINRNENLSNVLRALEESGIHFRLEKERRLIVMPN